MTPAGRWLIDGRADRAIAPEDRGLAYGDGLFETIAFRDGVPRLLARHLARLEAGCVQLGIPPVSGELLRAATVFDLYRGEQVGEDRKSLAFRLEFRAPDRTLTDAEVAERREAIKRELDEIGGTLRE